VRSRQVIGGFKDIRERWNVIKIQKFIAEIIAQTCILSVKSSLTVFLSHSQLQPL
jgi:hypothetical protein